MALTNVLKAANGMYNSHPREFFPHPIRSEHWRYSTNDREGRPEQNSDAAFGINFKNFIFIAVW
jgi:hypothetical protein